MTTKAYMIGVLLAILVVAFIGCALLGLLTTWLLKSLGVSVLWWQATVGWFLISTLIGMFKKV